MPSPQQRGRAPVGPPEPPDPGQAGTIDGLAELMRLLKVWAGSPSYESIAVRVRKAWSAAGRPAADLPGKTTIVDCFRAGRRRLNPELVLAVVQALYPDVGYVAQWRQALQVVGGLVQATSQVRVQDSLPRDLAFFTGRTTELDRLRRALLPGSGGAVVSLITGMAGVGKTQLAVHAGHLLARDSPFERVFFVNLRGFYPDSAQPPADPGAVLDGFLRLLGVPGHQIPQSLGARAEIYRERLVRIRALVVLDNAASEEQVRPLLPGAGGCRVLVTSRRRLTRLRPASQVTVDVFSAVEAQAFLAAATSPVSIGLDPRAAARIAQRCGYLPLALGLLSGHIRGIPGWTLTDHADRLDERHHHRLPDTGVESAFALSYSQLPAGRQRLLRLTALHPAEDFDVHAAAALADGDLPGTQLHLDQLCRDHLLQQSAPGRFTFHDLVRAYAAGRAGDADPPTVRRAAMTRLFDYYLGASAAAMDVLHPAEADRRPRIPPPATPPPAMPDLETARRWLDSERPALIAVAGYTANQGWPTHTMRLSTVLFRYLDGGHYADAVTVHRHAHDVARRAGDRSEQAWALYSLGAVDLQTSRYEPATRQFTEALILFRQIGDRGGQARVLGNLGVVEQRLGRYESARTHFGRALTLYRRAGDRIGEARALVSLGDVEMGVGQHGLAADHIRQALVLHRQAGYLLGEAYALYSLGDIETRQGRYAAAVNHLGRSLTLLRQTGDQAGEAWVLNSLGAVHMRLDQPDVATTHHRRALDILDRIGQRDGTAMALNGLGEAAHAAGRPGGAVSHFTAALAISIDIGSREQEARAHAGLGRVNHTLAEYVRARDHCERALAIYLDLAMPEADQVRAALNSMAGAGAFGVVRDSSR
jgi:tetratricopeptide (TPR) repeat protein